MNVLRFCALAMLASLQSGPAILSNSNIQDEYESVPADLRDRTWLGVYITGAPAGGGQRASRLEPVRVSFVARTEAGRAGYRIVASPPNPDVLLSGIPGLSAGMAVTADGYGDLGIGKREAEFRLSGRVYTIRLQSARPDECDARVTMTSGQRTQTLFDASRPGTTNDPALILACDEPHFDIHWAGDLDRDGRLDLLVTFSPKYSYYPNQLLLSSMAGAGDLVAEAGRYEQFAQ